MKELFKEKLKQCRKDKKLTQKEVALKLGVVESCYANYEQGRTEPNLDIMQKLCLIFNVSADYLLGLENEDGTKNIVNSFNNINNSNIKF